MTPDQLPNSEPVPTETPAPTTEEAGVEAPQLKEKFLLKLVLTAFGLFFWGIILGVSYALSSYTNPEVGGAVGSAFIIGTFYALPMLVVMAIIGLLVKTRHAQKVVYWITVVLFTIAGILDAYLVHALSDPNLE
jgi:hypothetical protein